MRYTAEAVESCRSTVRVPVAAPRQPPACDSCLSAIYIIWGSTYLAIRYAVETIPPLYTAGFRHLLAGRSAGVGARERDEADRSAASGERGDRVFLLPGGTRLPALGRTNRPEWYASLLIAIEPIFVFLLSSMAARSLR